MLGIEWIRDRIAHAEYYFSRHGDLERQKENLTLSAVEEALLSGRILEPCPDTGRGESCLVGGFAQAGIPIHAVCGLRGDWMVIVTVYVPKPPKFKTPYERG